VELVRAKTKGGSIDLAAVLTELGRREILSVLLEAGPGVNGSALRGNLVHKLELFYAPKIAGNSAAPFAIAAGPQLVPPQTPRVEQFGPDLCVEFYLRDAYRG
jgi:diaminohydroxyphosphoribosylaminopyrimidine deaminase/5-amino-6-(5-phosphoribosylamino)uracil reductase